MKKRAKPNWVWRIYFLIYLLFTIFKTYDFFAADSAMQTYYQFLLAFDLTYFVPYCLNILSVILNAFSIIPFFFFLRQVFILSPLFWRLFFVARLALDVTGRSYEFTFVKSLFYQDIETPVLIIVTVLAIILPSYWALFRYAFRWKNPEPV